MFANRLKVRNGANVTGVIYFVNDMDDSYYIETVEVHNASMKLWIS